MTALLDRLRLFSIREFAVHRARTAASITVVAVSAAFLVAVMGISGSVNGSVDRLAGGLAGNAELEVSGVTDAGFPQSIRDEVATVPGVDAAVPMLQTQTPTDSGPVLLLGADGNAAALNSALKGALTNQISELLTVPNGVLIGPNTGYAKGDTFRLGAGRVTVADVLQGKQQAKLNGGHYVLAPLGMAQHLANRVGQLDSVLVVANSRADRDTVRSAVTNAVAGRAIVGTPWLKAAQSGNGLALVRYMTLAGSSVSFIVSAFLIYTAMTMAITQRRPVISMLRAIGGRRTTIVRDLLAESAVLGLIGGALGAGLGIAMGRMAISSLPAAMTQTVQARIEYFLPWYSIPVSLAASVLTSVAASAVAARQVYKVSPVEALAPVGVSSADQIRLWLRVTAFAVGTALFVGAVGFAFAHLGTVAIVAIAGSFVALIGLCFAMTEQLVAACARTARLFGAPGALAAATIERAPRRVWATLMTVLIAVSMTISITGSNKDTIQAAQATFAPLADAAAWVSPTPPEEFPTGPLLPADLAEKVRAVPGVAKVSGGQLAFASISGTKVTLFGVNAGADSPLYKDATPDVRAAVMAGQGVILSRDLGRSLHVAVGDDLTLQTPLGVQHTKVLALVSYFSAVTGSVVMNVDQMRTWFERPGETLLQVDALPGVDRTELITRIRAASPPDVHVYSGAQSVDGVNLGMRQGMNLSNAIWIIVVLIATVALLNTLTLSVLERRRELGVLRAMGSSRRFALQMIWAEAASIGIVGGVVGMVFGLLNQYLFDVVTPDIMSIDVPFRPTAVVLMFAACACALSLLGSIPPALRAARLNIIEAVSVE